MLRAIVQAIFILMFVRLVVWAARLLGGGRRDEEISPGAAAERRGGSASGDGGRASRGSRSRHVPPGEIVDVPFTEIPPPESSKRM